MPSDPRDYKVELSGAANGQAECPQAADATDAGRGATARPFLSVVFACCGAYQRVYRDSAGKDYHGRCPRCGRPVRFVVGEGGTSARCFVER